MRSRVPARALIMVTREPGEVVSWTTTMPLPRAPGKRAAKATLSAAGVAAGVTGTPAAAAVALTARET